jgi:hypothetical protein
MKDELITLRKLLAGTARRNCQFTPHRVCTDDETLLLCEKMKPTTLEENEVCLRLLILSEM